MLVQWGEVSIPTSTANRIARKTIAELPYPYHKIKCVTEGKYQGP